MRLQKPLIPMNNNIIVIELRDGAVERLNVAGLDLGCTEAVVLDYTPSGEQAQKGAVCLPGNNVGRVLEIEPLSLDLQWYNTVRNAPNPLEAFEHRIWKYSPTAVINPPGMIRVQAGSDEAGKLCPRCCQARGFHAVVWGPEEPVSICPGDWYARGRRGGQELGKHRRTGVQQRCHS